jgi:hypothetical protein
MNHPSPFPSPLQINMDSDVFRNSSKLSSQRWRAVVTVILTDMGAHDSTLEEKGCTLYLYVDTVQGVVMGMIITEQVRASQVCLLSLSILFLYTTELYTASLHSTPYRHLLMCS